MLMCFLIEKKEITKHRSHFMYKTDGFPGLLQHKTHVTNKGEHKTTKSECHNFHSELRYDFPTAIMKIYLACTVKLHG